MSALLDALRQLETKQIESTAAIPRRAPAANLPTLEPASQPVAHSFGDSTAATLSLPEPIESTERFAAVSDAAVSALATEPVSPLGVSSLSQSIESIDAAALALEALDDPPVTIPDAYRHSNAQVGTSAAASKVPIHRAPSAGVFTPIDTTLPATERRLPSSSDQAQLDTVVENSTHEVPTSDQTVTDSTVKLAPSESGAATTQTGRAAASDDSSVVRGERRGSRPDRRAFQLRPPSPQRDQIHSLASRILTHLPHVELPAMAFTSAGSEDGKTSLVAQLGTAMADQNAGEILLIDADLHKPTLSRIFGVDGERGLADLVLGWASPEEVILPTSVDRLSIVACGTYVKAGCDQLPRFSWVRLLGQLAPRYSVVLIDTPAATHPEVLPLCRAVPGTFFVVRLEHTDRAASREVCQSLSSGGARLLGCVVTQPTHRIG